VARRRRRRNPGAGDVVPWLVGGAVVLGVGYVIMQQLQAQNNLLAQGNALAGQQPGQPAQPGQPNPVNTGITTGGSLIGTLFGPGGSSATTSGGYTYPAGTPTYNIAAGGCPPGTTLQADGLTCA
jgi:hypothetical protein